MGVAAHMVALQADPLQPLGHQLPVIALTASGLQSQRFGYDFLYGHTRVQGGIGILENHLDVGGKPLEIPLAVALWQRLAAKQNVAAGFCLQSRQGATQGSFTAATLAHQAEYLVFGNVQGNAVHRVHDPVSTDPEVGLEVAYF